MVSAVAPPAAGSTTLRSIFKHPDTQDAVGQKPHRAVTLWPATLAAHRPGQAAYYLAAQIAPQAAPPAMGDAVAPRHQAVTMLEHVAQYPAVAVAPANLL